MTCYGFSTTKTAAGYRWTVYSFDHGKGQETLHTGTCATRAQATGRAKKIVVRYRRARG